jgi:hypothetical protein
LAADIPPLIGLDMSMQKRPSSAGRFVAQLATLPRQRPGIGKSVDFAVFCRPHRAVDRNVTNSASCTLPTVSRP